MKTAAPDSPPLPAHAFPFDPTYGYDRPALLRVGPAPEPPDFSDFWRRTYAAARTVATDASVVPSRKQVRGFDVFDVTYNSFGSVRIGSWLMLPAGRPARRGLVISHGYGGRDEPDPLPLLPDAAMIFPCARGISASAQPGIPAAPPQHVLHGIASRETYVHRGCVADIWAAATVLLEQVPTVATRLDYVGTSFGGGIGALALPWDRRFHGAFLGLPSFGQHPLRLTLPSIGSGEAVRVYAQSHPEVAQVLSYFDASIAARHIRQPVLVAAALADPFVPPPGQFAIYNALAGPRQLLTLQAGHFDWPGAAAEEAAQHAALVNFLQHPAMS